MQIMYVDESGDPGASKFSSQHYILSGIVVGQDDWKESLDRLRTFRRYLKSNYGLSLRTEIHAAELIRVNGIEAYRKIRKTQRIRLLKDFISEIPNIFQGSRVINVCLEKADFPSGTDFFTLAWKRLVQRYNTHLQKDLADKGIIISDHTDEKALRGLIRKMRVYNPVTSHFGGYRQVLIDNILEDPFMKHSHYSLFLQASDAIAHSLYRREFPKGSLKKFNLEVAFNQLEPILLKAASKTDPYGIVRK